MLSVQLEDVMVREVVTVSTDSTVREIVCEFHEHDIGSVVVVDNGEVAGMVTQSDVIAQVAEENLNRKASEFMSSPVVTANPTDTVRDAIDKLEGNRIKHLPIVHGGLVGILSTRDLSYYFRTRHDHKLSDSLEVSYEDEDWKFERIDADDDQRVSVGDTVRFTKVIDEDDVHSFADASGDTNRVHLEEEFAKRTRFKGRIVHGTLVSGLISSALARIPGLTIYLSQELTFLNPVKIGETVTAACEIVEALGKNRYRLVTKVYDEAGELVIDGEATVLIDPLPDE